jgi:hypothetical protein
LRVISLVVGLRSDDEGVATEKEAGPRMMGALPLMLRDLLPAVR